MTAVEQGSESKGNGADTGSGDGGSGAEITEENAPEAVSAASPEPEDGSGTPPPTPEDGVRVVENPDAPAAQDAGDPGAPKDDGGGFGNEAPPRPPGAVDPDATPDGGTPSANGPAGDGTGAEINEDNAAEAGTGASPEPEDAPPVGTPDDGSPPLVAGRDGDAIVELEPNPAVPGDEVIAEDPPQLAQDPTDEPKPEPKPDEVPTVGETPPGGGNGVTDPPGTFVGDLEPFEEAVDDRDEVPFRDDDDDDDRDEVPFRDDDRDDDRDEVPFRDDDRDDVRVGDDTSVGDDAPVGDDGGLAEQVGEVEIELPELYEPSPAYASDSATAPAGHDAPATDTTADAAAYEPAAPVAAVDCEPDTTDDPVTADVAGRASDGDDGSGLLDQVADAIGDIFDEAKDVVT